MSNQPMPKLLATDSEMYTPADDFDEFTDASEPINTEESLEADEFYRMPEEQ